MAASRTEIDGSTGFISQQSMVQLLRGELSRSDTWRTRLDTTTNWALGTAAAVVSFAFSTTTASHVVLLVGFWLVFSFLMIEARRYRYFDIWHRRVRLLESGYWAALLRREPPDPDAMRELAAELARPQLRLSLFSAVATRMNRAYGPIMLLILCAWYVKLTGHPSPVRNWDEFFYRAHIGPVSGEVVVALVAVSSAVFLLTFVTAMVTRPPIGELRPGPGSRGRSLTAMFRPYAQPRLPAPTRRASDRPSGTGVHAT